jgi:SHQ1 protein
VTCATLLRCEQVWSTDVQAVVVAGARRSLCYPYLRSWPLTHKCLRDVATILQAGRRVVLKCLLSLHATIGGSEYHYLLNKVHNMYILLLASLVVFRCGCAQLAKLLSSKVQDGCNSLLYKGAY